MHTYFIFFIHLSGNEHWSFFLFLSVVNSAALNVRVQISLGGLAFNSFVCKPRSETPPFLKPQNSFLVLPKLVVSDFFILFFP